MPAVASMSTESQRTAARAAGVRATSARSHALYECTSCANCALVKARPLIQPDGSGKPFAPVAVLAVAVQVSAESRSRSAAAIRSP